MQREGTIGAATLLAIAAVVGVSLQTGPRQPEGSRTERNVQTKRSKLSIAAHDTHKVRPGCTNLQSELEAFLAIEDLILPKQCYISDDAPPDKVPEGQGTKPSRLKFVIALMPDPLHTHLSRLFDQFAVALQEGAQDEKYDFDSSWLPWDDDDPPYALLADEKASSWEKDFKESQPGIILFRKMPVCSKRTSDVSPFPPARQRRTVLRSPWFTVVSVATLALGMGVNSDLFSVVKFVLLEDLPYAKPSQPDENVTCKEEVSGLYNEGLVVFVVGEDATHGIHREQFYNALDWIAALQPKADTEGKRLAILGPTFSGSLPSLAQLLRDPKIAQQLDLGRSRDNHRLAIHSGSVSSGRSAQFFRDTLRDQVVFHSFVQNDEEILKRFCDYLGNTQPGLDFSRLAIVSEDETAYGGVVGVVNEEPRAGTEPGGGVHHDEAKVCTDKALKLFYPRDISALRAAYQTKSLFDAGIPSSPAEAQRRNLPTDFSDPAGKVHDSIRRYGGEQTPLAQEAYLIEMVAALRQLDSAYILLRSSNSLDQLFLANFLRRSYPDGRIVILGSDLMFIRERGSTGLSGAMTLSTYPLFPLGRDWTEHQSLPAPDRTFSADTPEGVYIAFRLLLND
jgi:hypothetical protein